MCSLSQPIIQQTRENSPPPNPPQPVEVKQPVLPSTVYSKQVSTDSVGQKINISSHSEAINHLQPPENDVMDQEVPDLEQFNGGNGFQLPETNNNNNRVTGQALNLKYHQQRFYNQHEEAELTNQWNNIVNTLKNMPGGLQNIGTNNASSLRDKLLYKTVDFCVKKYTKHVFH